MLKGSSHQNAMQNMEHLLKCRCLGVLLFNSERSTDFKASSVSSSAIDCGGDYFFCKCEAMENMTKCGFTYLSQHHTRKGRDNVKPVM